MIQHPDHTGASANPDAPWNQPDARIVVCNLCSEEHEEQFDIYAPGLPCRNTQCELDAAGNEIPPCTGAYIYREDD